jgi:hypothetical protein
MSPRVKISAAEFVQDLRAGLTSSELMDKYSLPARELDGVLAQLNNALVDPGKVYGRASQNATSGTADKIRFFRRHKIDLPVVVCDANNPAIRGEVRDVSEKGLGVQKMDTTVDEFKNLVVLANEYFPISPFGFEAQCRWTCPTTDARRFLAGFEIIKISEECFKNLVKFIKTYENLNGQSAETAPGLSETSVLETPRNEARWVCPFCEMPQPMEFEECPQCGIIVAKYLSKLEANKKELKDIIEMQPSPPAPPPVKPDSIGERTITISANVWKELEALGGDPQKHLNTALSTYLLRARASGTDRKDGLSGQ